MPRASNKPARDTSSRVTHEQIDEFERVVNQLDALHQEFISQAKSKPDSPINTFKLRMLNEKIAAANKILAGAYKPFEGFSAFDETALPTNSDVSFVLTTYLASLERWRSAHVETSPGYAGYVWKTNEAEKLRAVAPTSYNPSVK